MWRTAFVAVCGLGVWSAVGRTAPAQYVGGPLPHHHHHHGLRGPMPFPPGAGPPVFGPSIGIAGRRGFGISVNIGRLHFSFSRPGNSFTFYQGPVGGPPVWGPPGAAYGYAPAPQATYPAAPQSNLPQNNTWDGAPLAVEPLAKPSPLAVQNPSTPLAKERSLRMQGEGDMWFRQQDYHRAYERYKAAIAAAPDRPETYFRLALTFAALGYYDQAVREVKRGLQVNPQVVVTGEDLATLFGRDGSVAKAAVLERATLWAQEDLRDPKRLFLLGVLLHFDGDRQRARPLLEAAEKFAGGDHDVEAFLGPAQDTPPEPAGPQPAAVVPPAPAAEQAPPPAPVGPDSSPKPTEKPAAPPVSGPALPPPMP